MNELDSSDKNHPHNNRNLIEIDQQKINNVSNSASDLTTASSKSDVKFIFDSTTRHHHQNDSQSTTFEQQVHLLQPSTNSPTIHHPLRKYASDHLHESNSPNQMTFNRFLQDEQKQLIPPKSDDFIRQNLMHTDNQSTSFSSTSLKSALRSSRFEQDVNNDESSAVDNIKQIKFGRQAKWVNFVSCLSNLFKLDSTVRTRQSVLLPLSHGCSVYVRYSELAAYNDVMVTGEDGNLDKTYKLSEIVNKIIRGQFFDITEAQIVSCWLRLIADERSRNESISATTNAILAVFIIVGALLCTLLVSFAFQIVPTIKQLNNQNSIAD